MEQLYQDAKVAAILCVGGPVKYGFEEGVDGITDEWLFQNVVPNIRRRFPNDRNLCVVLAKALLYICLKHQSEDDDDTVIPVPEHIREKIRAAYNMLGLEED